jgi:hypothetical protein
MPTAQDVLSKLVAADDALTDAYERSSGINDSNHRSSRVIGTVSKAIDRDRTIVALGLFGTSQSPHRLH